MAVFITLSQVSLLQELSSDARTAAQVCKDIADEKRARELSIAATKFDEARLWIEELLAVADHEEAV
jgi:hypothetical protein